MTKPMIAVALIVASIFPLDAGARSLFGCDFSDCTSEGVPGIGGGSGSGGGGSGGSGTGSTGTTTYFDQPAWYNADLETWIENRFVGWQFQPTTPFTSTCVFGGGGGECSRVNITGRKDQVYWTYSLTPNYQRVNPGLAIRGSEYGQRYPDREAAMRPPWNNDATRCKDNCDKIQRKEVNQCNLTGSELAVVSYLTAQAGAAWLATTAGTAVGAVSGGTAGVPVGLVTFKGTSDILVPISRDLTGMWTNLCVSRANDRWVRCLDETCRAFFPLLAIPLLRSAGKGGKLAWLFAMLKKLMPGRPVMA